MPPGLELRESPIHGLGVFATRDFPARHKFGPYTGEEMSLREFKERYGTDIQYCMVLRRQNKVIVAKECRNFVTWVNDGTYGQEHPVENVKLECRQLVAIRPIASGEELLLHYPKGYFGNAVVGGRQKK